MFKHLNINYEDVSIDLYGTKKERIKKRYILTTLNLPYNQIDSFSMELRPWELNIINNIKGNKIFLYDTTQKVKNLINDSKVELNKWIYLNRQIPKWSLILSLIKYKIKYKYEILRK